MTAQTRPEPPPEAALIKTAQKRARITVRQAAADAGLSTERWRQITTGYQSVRGGYVEVHAPDDTLARMAHAVSVTPDQLTEAGRAEAADILRELIEEHATRADPYAADPHIDAIAQLLATLPPEAQDEVLRRVGRAAPPADSRDQRGQHRHAG